MIRLIISDVDGTLAPEGSPHINPEYMDMIRKFRDKGIQFAVASGRQANSLLSPFREVSDLLYFLPDNGGSIKRGSHTISASYMEEEHVKGLLTDLAKLPGCHTVISTAEASYTDSRDPEFIRLILEEYRLGSQIVDDLFHYTKGCVKVSVYHTEGSQLIYDHLYPNWHDKVNAVISGKRWADINAIGVSKGKAVKWLQQELGIAPEETVVFGDNFNDIPMFHQAGISYASVDSHPDVQKEANHLFASCREDGVLQVLKQIWKEIR